MSTPALAQPLLSQRPAGRRGDGATAGERRVFEVCLAVVALHLVVVAILATGTWEPWVMLAGAALAPLGVLTFRTQGRLVCTLLAGVIGLAATAAGLAHHIPRLVLGSPKASDVTGALLALAGLALIGLAFRVALRGRRRRVKLLAIPAALVLLQWFALPVLGAGLVTNTARPHVPAAASLGIRGARDVTFPARDGTHLSGWYVPGRSGRAVILMHGSHGTRASTLAHLRMLAAAGFGVLAFDARGHGKSRGQTNALGWQGANDVAGAVAFLRRQPGVNPRDIAALGLSMGGEMALRAAGEGTPLAAVIADGAGASTSGDQSITSQGPVAESVSWLTMRVVEAFSGDSEPRPLVNVVRGVGVPTLLIASNAKDERAIDEALQNRIGKRATLWFLPDVAHTRGLARHPVQYRQRVIGFLDDALPAD